MKSETKLKHEARARRRARIRARVAGSAEAPRLAVFRSAKHIHAQLIDDGAGRTLVSARDGELKKSDRKGEEGMGAKVATAYSVGKLLAEKAKQAGISRAVFDRGGYAYHGRVKAVADGARAGGLKF